MNHPTYELVVGLEVHVQLKTRTKIFCSCPTQFGAAPNANTCPVCLALPGALPVLNAHAVQLAVRAALALECTVHPVSVFARKNYFYPDLPKGYQISQFDQPIATGGRLAIGTGDDGTPRVLGVTRAHMEEDAGKTFHDRFPSVSAIDLNRAGTPLVEIVSEPDMRTPAEAREYCTRLKEILEYTEVSDANMEEGSLRVDANVSIRRHGETALGTKTEIKNMNSFANVERALTAERERQVALLESGGRVEQVSLLFNAATGAVRPSRSKEDSHDYRYFPDPDLPHLVLDEAFIEEQRRALPELPDARRARFETGYGLSAYHAQELTGERAVADYFEATVKAGAEAKAVVGWVLGEVMAGYNASGRFAWTPVRLAELIAASKTGAVSHQAAKQIFGYVLKAEPGEYTVTGIAAELGLVQVQDTGALEGWVDEVLAANPGEVARFKGGETKLIGFFVGQVMKKSGGKADPKGVAPILQQKLKD